LMRQHEEEKKEIDNGKSTRHSQASTLDPLAACSHLKKIRVRCPQKGQMGLEKQPNADLPGQSWEGCHGSDTHGGAAPPGESARVQHYKWSGRVAANKYDLDGGNCEYARSRGGKKGVVTTLAGRGEDINTKKRGGRGKNRVRKRRPDKKDGT